MSELNDWCNNTVLIFLELYEAEPVLWNPKHRQHKDKVALNDAWLRISASLNKPVVELRKKKESLMAAYRKHAKKKRDSIVSGAGTEDIYQPSWFAYSYMEQFLQPVFDPEPTISTQRNEENTVEDQSFDDSSVNISRDGHIRSATDLQVSQPRRRSQNPRELQEANDNMKRAFTTVDNALNMRKQEDDCDLFAKLLANKLRKISEDEREDIMYEIYGLIHAKMRSHQDARDSPSSQTSSRTSTTRSFMQTPQNYQYVQIASPESPQYYLSNPSQFSYAVPTPRKSPTCSSTQSTEAESAGSVVQPDVMSQQIHIPESKRIRIIKSQTLEPKAHQISGVTKKSDILSQTIINTECYNVIDMPTTSQHVYTIPPEQLQYDSSNEQNDETLLQ